ncbi:MAG: polyphosphate polymerase domain-containing protein [Clostridia bacterium]|nr:polyphosphate polymerase domain-containing protein [Clostridia bacterium]
MIATEPITIFQRVEKKYPMTVAQRDAFLAEFQGFLVPDFYGKSTVCSLYLDTPDRRIIRASVDAKGFDKPAYKEKLRLRSYGTPKGDSNVFFEIKKKFRGVVYKRRLMLPLSDAIAYLKGGEKPVSSQIMEEIHWAMSFYGNPRPSMLLSCEREAYTGKDTPRLRITFDTGIRYRETELDLSAGSHGTPLLPEDAVLMEIKTDGAIPLWLAHGLDKHRLYPASFSKYGTAYLRSLK